MTARRGQASAPGKVVLSGSYSVLEGAPAIVAAVDRYVIADASRRADFVTAEVRAAIDAGSLDFAPWFDASALRVTEPDGSSRKLGIGSSAAILVASLAAASPEGASREALFEQALAAHRVAQGGGSGVDVAASVFGGILVCSLNPTSGSLDVRPHALPSGTVVEVFSSPISAETRSLLRLVRAFAERAPKEYRSLMDRSAAGANLAMRARAPSEFIEAFREQTMALGELGEKAGAPIVTPETARLAAIAESEGAAFGPSGAGGGDIALFIGAAASSDAFRAEARGAGLSPLAMQIAARCRF